MASASYIARALAGNFGITPVEVSEPDDIQDGVVRFDEFADRHVQVGFSYACIVQRTEDDNFIFRPYRKRLSDLFADLSR